jgi:hypothetical protein
MTPARAASITAVSAWGLVALLLWSATAGASVGDDDRLFQVVLAAALVGTPLALAGAVLTHRIARVAHAGDLSERLLRLATAGLPSSKDDWGAAMRAELASIVDPGERRRFAIGCTKASFRMGRGRAPWVVALGIGVAFAVGTFLASRATLDGGRGGIIGFAIAWPPLVLFAVTFLSARAARSFRTALMTGGLASLAGLVGMLTVSMTEAAHWHRVAGVYLMDGDVPMGGLGRLDAILDPVTPSFLALYLLVWVPWPVIGAASGSWRKGTSRDAGQRSHGPEGDRLAPV